MPKDDDCWPQMTLDECLAFADEWSRGMTYHTGSQGWRVVCMLLAEEVREMRAELDEQCRLLGMSGSREARLMAQLAESQAREAKLRETLLKARHALEFANDSQNGPICDTIWMMHGPETLFDFLDAAIEAPAEYGALREMIEAAKAEEREACAKVCDRQAALQTACCAEDDVINQALRCAADIRNR